MLLVGGDELVAFYNVGFGAGDGDDEGLEVAAFGVLFEVVADGFDVVQIFVDGSRAVT